MSNVLLIVQLIISIILTGLILIQRSEGGALGIGGGGGGGGGGFMSGRSAASTISRATAILGGVFIINCLVLSIVFNIETREQSIIDAEGEVETLTIDTDSGETITPSIDVSSEASATEETLDDIVEEVTDALKDSPEADPVEATEKTPDNP
ncbi:MAG: preprotein translocase subunit SecG [Maricaulaceae bacterium]